MVFPEGSVVDVTLTTRGSDRVVPTGPSCPSPETFSKRKVFSANAVKITELPLLLLQMPQTKILCRDHEIPS